MMPDKELGEIVRLTGHVGCATAVEGVRLLVAERDKAVALHAELAVALAAVGERFEKWAGEVGSRDREIERLKEAIDWFVRLVTADPDGEIEWATIREWLTDFAGHVDEWRDKAAERDQFAALLARFARGHLYADEELRHLPDRDATPLNPYDPARSPTVGDCRAAAAALG